MNWDIDWIDLLWTSVYLALPLILAGTFHMFCVKADVFPKLKVPVRKSLFGANKTWRGFVVMPTVTAIATSIVGLFEDPSLKLFAWPDGMLLGTLLGLAYVTFELPNSYLKRRMGIPPGQLATENRTLFFLLDHLDSLIGCAIVYAFWRIELWPAVLALFVVGPLIHVGVNLILYGLRIRKQPF